MFHFLNHTKNLGSGDDGALMIDSLQTEGRNRLLLTGGATDDTSNLFDF